MMKQAEVETKEDVVSDDSEQKDEREKRIEIEKVIEKAKEKVVLDQLLIKLKETIEKAIRLKTLKIKCY